MESLSLSLHSPCDCARVCVGDGSGLFSCFKSDKSQWLKTADVFALFPLTIMGYIKINTFFLFDTLHRAILFRMSMTPVVKTTSQLEELFMERCFLEVALIYHLKNIN